MHLTRHCFALDLKDDPKLIAAYDAYHQHVWPEILQSIREAGIVSMEIYRVRNRLFMIMEVDATFSFESKSAADQANPQVRKWEELMWEYQQALPFAKAGEKWMLMKEMFKFKV